MNKSVSEEYISEFQQDFRHNIFEQEDKYDNDSTQNNNDTQNSIKCTKLIPPNIQDKGKTAMILDNVFSDKECENLIALVNNGQFYKVTPKRRKWNSNLPDNDQRYCHSQFIADQLYSKIKQYLPDSINDHEIHSIDERLSFLKYGQGQVFENHTDVHVESKKKISFLTAMIYLTEDVVGGETTLVALQNNNNNNQNQQNSQNSKNTIFQSQNKNNSNNYNNNFDIDNNQKEIVLRERDVKVAPKKGRVFIFDHDIYHGGYMVESGQKICIMTQIMFSYPKN